MVVALYMTYRVPHVPAVGGFGIHIDVQGTTWESVIIGKPNGTNGKDRHPGGEASKTNGL